MLVVLAGLVASGVLQSQVLAGKPICGERVN